MSRFPSTRGRTAANAATAASETGGDPEAWRGEREVGIPTRLVRTRMPGGLAGDAGQTRAPYADLMGETSRTGVEEECLKGTDCDDTL